MAPQVLFYEQAVAISSDQHRDVAVEARRDYAFARGTSLVPIVAAEFAAAGADYAIVFVGKDDDIVPGVVLGVRDGENLFVDANGGWPQGYVPAFVRRYPFVFASQPGNSQLILCIDEAAPAVNRDGRGDRLFESSGERTNYLQNVLDFMQRYQASFLRSQRLARRLRELELLQPVQAQLRGPAGEIQLRGFMTVNREKLAALDGAVVDELFRSGALEAVYAHLASLRNLSGLAQRAGSTSSAPIVDDGLNEGDILVD